MLKRFVIQCHEKQIQSGDILNQLPSLQVSLVFYKSKSG